MKRDIDLIRNILLDIESHNDLISIYIEPNKEYNGINGSDLLFHINLLCDENYIIADINYILSGGAEVKIARLTNQGCDFLDSIRDDSAFGKLKAEMKKRWPAIAIDGVAKIFHL